MRSPRIARPPMAVGDEPHSIASGTSAIWVANAGDGTVSTDRPRGGRGDEDLRGRPASDVDRGGTEVGLGDRQPRPPPSPRSMPRARSGTRSRSLRSRAASRSAWRRSGSPAGPRTSSSDSTPRRVSAWANRSRSTGSSRPTSPSATRPSTPPTSAARASAGSIPTASSCRGSDAQRRAVRLNRAPRMRRRVLRSRALIVLLTQLPAAAKPGEGRLAGRLRDGPPRRARPHGADHDATRRGDPLGALAEAPAARSRRHRALQRRGHDHDDLRRADLALHRRQLPLRPEPAGTDRPRVRSRRRAAWQNGRRVPDASG